MGCIGKLLSNFASWTPIWGESKMFQARSSPRVKRVGQLMHILVVENECLTAHYVAHVIRDLGSDVAGIATTSLDALDMIETEHIDAADS